jgi:hypothetical protein
MPHIHTLHGEKTEWKGRHSSKCEFKWNGLRSESSVVLPNFDFEVFELSGVEDTFSNVLTMASEVSLFSRLISVMISCADLFSCFWLSSPSMSSSSSGRILSTRNFLSSWGFFLTFSLNSATSAISAVRSFANASCNLFVSPNSTCVARQLPLLSPGGTWHCPTARPAF